LRHPGGNLAGAVCARPECGGSVPADGCVGQRLEDYAPLALALGRDPVRRQALREASLDAAGRELFGDIQAVREFEAFLEAAIDAAGSGQKLPSGWRPDIRVQQVQQGATA